jgi:leucyl/phenylalanyl-tRNA--protein transferase
MSTPDQELVRDLLRAYRNGLFPMGDPGTGAVDWYDPDPRAVIPLEPGAFRVARSLRQRVRSGRFAVTSDRAFSHVIRACAAPRPDNGVWINEPIIRAYTILHAHGHAHSVEAWLDADSGPQLVGGLYGVTLGGLFAGESMFSRPDRGGSDASKVCLVHLVGHLRRKGFTLLDTQLINPHMRRLGCVEIRRREYRKRLAQAAGLHIAWEPFEPLGCEEAPR